MLYAVIFLAVYSIGITVWFFYLHAQAAEAIGKALRLGACVHARTDEHNIQIAALEEFWQSRGPCKICGKHRYEADFPHDDLCGTHPVNVAQGELRLIPRGQA